MSWFRTIIEDEKTLESLSKDNLMALVKAQHEENKSLNHAIKPLRAELTMLERNLKIAQNNYLCEAKEFEDFKSKSIKARKRAVAKARKRPGPENPVGPSKKATRTLPPPKHFKCTICPINERDAFVFYQIEEYRQHVKAIHLDHEWFCDWCPHSFKTIADLKQHCTKFGHIGEHYGCNLCGISFANVKLYNTHLLLFHKP